MVNGHAALFCTNCYKPSSAQFYCLPLKKAKVLKISLWNIRGKSIPINKYIWVCSAHFSGSPKRPGPNDIPSIFAWSKQATP